MSGGSMDYAYRQVEEAMERFDQRTPERRAFADHLKRVAEALKAIEWVDSGDYGPGDENEAIRACLAPGEALEAAVRTAREAYDSLAGEIVRAEMKLCNEAGSDGVRKLP